MAESCGPGLTREYDPERALKQDPAYIRGFQDAIALAAQVIDDERGCDRCSEIVRAVKL